MPPSVRPIAKLGARGRFHDRLHHGVLEIAAYFAIGCLRHQDADDLFLRVDPEVGAVGAAPPEASLRQECIPGDRVGDDPDAQAVALAGRATGQRVRDERRPHQLHGPGTQQPPAIELATVQEHLRELQVVLGRAHQPAAAGKVGAVHEVRLGHVHLAERSVLPMNRGDEKPAAGCREQHAARALSTDL